MSKKLYLVPQIPDILKLLYESYQTHNLKGKTHEAKRLYDFHVSGFLGDRKIDKIFIEGSGVVTTGELATQPAYVQLRVFRGTKIEKTESRGNNFLYDISDFLEVFPIVDRFFGKFSRRIKSYAMARHISKNLKEGEIGLAFFSVIFYPERYLRMLAPEIELEYVIPEKDLEKVVRMILDEKITRDEIFLQMKQPEIAEMPEILQEVARTSRDAFRSVEIFLNSYERGRALNLYHNILYNKDVICSLQNKNPVYTEVIHLSRGLDKFENFLNTVKEMQTGVETKDNQDDIKHLLSLVSDISESIPNLSDELKSFAGVADQINKLRSRIEKELFELTKPQIPLTQEKKDNFINLCIDSVEKMYELKKQYDTRFKKLAETYVKLYHTLYQKCKEASELSLLPPMKEEKWELPNLEEITNVS